MPADSLKTIEKTFYSKNKAQYPAGEERRLTMNNENDADVRPDGNINERIQRCVNLIRQEKTYRVLLRYFCNIEKVIYPEKFDVKKHASSRQTWQSFSSKTDN